MNAPTTTPITGLRALASRRGKKTVTIAEVELILRKLSIKNTVEIQNMSKGLQADGQPLSAETPNVQTDTDGTFHFGELDVLKFIIAKGVDGGEEIDNETFNEFAIADMKELSEKIMEFNGLAEGK